MLDEKPVKDEADYKAYQQERFTVIKTETDIKLEALTEYCERWLDHAQPFNSKCRIHPLSYEDGCLTAHHVLIMDYI